MFSRAQQTVLQIFRKELHELDITPVQYGFLSYLIRDNGATPAQLSEHFGLEGSTVTGILDRLEKKGLVERKTDDHDRRTYHIVITETGWALSEEMLERAKRANRIVESMIGDENVKFFKQILHQTYSRKE